MSLLINGVCYSEASAAQVAINNQYPMVISGSTEPLHLSLSASSLNFDTGVWTFTTKNQNGVVVTNGTETFSTCIQGTNTDIPIGFVVLAIVFAALVGWATGIKIFGGRHQ